MVCKVAITCFVVCPNGSAVSVTVSPARLFDTVPLRVTCVPNLTTGAEVASVTCGGAPRTVIVPLSVG